MVVTMMGILLSPVEARGTAREADRDVVVGRMAEPAARSTGVSQHEHRRTDRLREEALHRKGYIPGLTGPDEPAR